MKTGSSLTAGTKLQAVCKNAPGDVSLEVSPVVEGRATVKATYKGLTKIFLIN